MWIVFLGAVASPLESNNYFVDQLVPMLKRLGIRDKHQLRKQLEEIVWMGNMCDQYLAIVWAKLAAGSKTKAIAVR